MANRTRLELRVVYCPACGHSHFGHDRLAEGNDDCRRTVTLMTIDAWTSIARAGKLKLTAAGRAALAQESKPESSP